MAGSQLFKRDLFSAEALAELCDFPALFERLNPDWVEEALAATGKATMRRRRLPSESIVWLLIGMALARHESIARIASNLDLVIEDVNARPTVAKSSLSKARNRLGPEPLKWLFEKTAAEWAETRARTDAWRGLALFGVDGTSVRVPDSEANFEAFGTQRAGERGETAFPLVRAVTIVALRSHLILAGTFSGHATGELTLANELWSMIPDDSLTIIDRNFANPKTLLPIGIGGKNRYWLTRARSNIKWEVVKKLGNKDVLVEIKVGSKARKENPELPESFTCRAIAYNFKGKESSWLLTSLVDTKAFPRKELIALYHERWEHELAYDEIKTDMLMRENTLRSTSPERVAQEIWGILLAYNLVRYQMTIVAQHAEVNPVRVSFTAVLHQLVGEWRAFGFTTPGAIPKHYLRLRKDLAIWILPERRSDREYPRAVKIKMSNYARKRPQRGNDAK
ncbi:MAG: IS4 family transposase [Hyphomicrobium sp.]|nr:IS4 family transposase [Hyphomicrobium sp.]